MFHFFDRRGEPSGGAETLSDSNAQGRAGWTAVDLVARLAYTSDGTSWRAAPVPGALEIPRLSVTPEVSGSPQADQVFGEASKDVVALRVTVNAGDDAVAAARLSNGYPDVWLLNPDSQLVIRSSSPITRVDVVLIGTAEAGTPGTANTPIVPGTTTEAEVLTAMQTFDFDSADNVLTAVLSCTPRYTNDDFVRVNVGGRSHA